MIELYAIIYSVYGADLSSNKLGKCVEILENSDVYWGGKFFFAEIKEEVQP